MITVISSRCHREVEAQAYDDKFESSEGFSPQIVGAVDPPVLEGPWPLLLGANEVRVKDQPEVEVPARKTAGRGKAGARCLSSAGSATAARSPGPRTSGRTGCPQATWDGRGIGVSGMRFIRRRASPERADDDAPAFSPVDHQALRRPAGPRRCRCGHPYRRGSGDSRRQRSRQIDLHQDPVGRL